MGVAATRVLALVLVLGCVNQARADALAAPAADEVELRARLASLDAYLADLQRPTRAYWATWLAVLSTIAASQATVAVIADEPAQRTQAITGASLSSAGTLITAFVPVPGRFASERLRRMPQGTRAEQLAKLEAGERWLRREARVTRRSTAWWVHLIGVGVAAGLTLGLGLGYDDNWLNAVGAGAGSLAMSETRIWTRPRRAIEYGERYDAMPTVRPELTLSPSGCVLRF
jgi:hypothetical protein